MVCYRESRFSINDKTPNPDIFCDVLSFTPQVPRAWQPGAAGEHRRELWFNSCGKRPGAAFTQRALVDCNV